MHEQGPFLTRSGRKSTGPHAATEGATLYTPPRARLQRVADLFPAKYPWWHPFVRDGEFHDPADTSLSDPLHVFAVAPTVVFAFGKEEGFSATRWRFRTERPLPG
jgi:hypothetical protein